MHHIHSLKTFHLGHVLIVNILLTFAKYFVTCPIKYFGHVVEANLQVLFFIIIEKFNQTIELTLYSI